MFHTDSRFQPVSEAALEQRLSFIRKTYAHLFGAIIAFIGVEAALVNAPFAPDLINLMVGGAYSWLVVLGLFMFIGWIADSWARKVSSPVMQYAGLALSVFIQAIIFLPLLYVAQKFGGPNTIATAGVATAFVFSGLTVAVFATKKDFSFLRSGLFLASFLAMGAIVGAIVFGFSLGLWFSVAMAGLASAYILYYTSNVLKHYHPSQHVAAAMALFSAVTLLFYYILRIVMAFGRD